MEEFMTEAVENRCEGLMIKVYSIARYGMASLSVFSCSTEQMMSRTQHPKKVDSSHCHPPTNLTSEHLPG